MDELLRLVIHALRGSWRFRWYAAGVAWLFALCGWTFVYSLPNVYEAKATFYVDASSRLRDVVQTLGMDADVSSRVFLVQQAMLGRPQLEKVARETDLDLRAKTPQEKDDMLARLLDSIVIESGRAREAANLFTITYRDGDRNMAIAVVRTLLNTFVEDVIDKKDSDTERAQVFLQDQLRHYGGLLEGVEQELEAFKKANPGFAPGSEGGYFERVRREREVVEDLREQVAVATAKRDELRRQLDSTQPYVTAATGAEAAAPTGDAGGVWQRMRELERLRQELLLRVTEQHPDVTAIDEQLAQLDGTYKRLSAAAGDGEGAQGANNPVYVQVQMSLSNANLELSALNSQIAEREQRLAALNAELDVAPERERRYVLLMRDYDKYKSLYDQIRLQTERERIGRVGDEQDVVTFNVIDPPAAPLEPVAPPRTLLLLAVLMVALGGGGAIAFFLHQARPVFQDAEDMAAVTGREVLGSVSLSWFESERQHHRRDLTAFTVAMAALCVCFVGVVLAQERAMALLAKLAAGLGS
jgi:polysaccharide chain length determinant protein (PEP-CTERM system associated)